MLRCHLAPLADTGPKQPRLEVKGTTFYGWYAKIGPILNREKVYRLALTFPQLVKCTTFSLRGNGIRKVELSRVDLQRLDILMGAQHLDFKENALTCIDFQDAAFQYALIFNASQNRLSSVQNIGLLWHLKELYLSHNRLKNLRFLRNTSLCRTLHILDVDHNKLSSLADIGELVLMSALRKLSLHDNPLPVGHLVEGFIILSCPHLTELGGSAVTEDVRHRVNLWSVSDNDGIEVAECVHVFREAFLEAAGTAVTPIVEDELESVPPEKSADEAQAFDTIDDVECLVGRQTPEHRYSQVFTNRA